MPSRRHFKLSNSNHKEQISKANWIPLYAISICQSSQLHLRSIGLTTQLLNRKIASSLLSKEIHFICIALCNRTQQFSKYCLTFFSRIGFQNFSISCLPTSINEIKIVTKIVATTMGRENGSEKKKDLPEVAGIEDSS